MEGRNGMTKVSDYIMNFLVKLGIRDVFYISGGGAMHMNDSLGSNPGLNAIAMLHEQGAAIAAEAYARIHKEGRNTAYSACLVTSGPGGTNTVTGVAGAWQDGTPVIFLSGQVKRADLTGEQGIRQFGMQEIDILSIVKSITKYAVQIERPEDIRYELEKAAVLAAHGKPGPVWIDVPLDIQASLVEEGKLKGYEGWERFEERLKREEGIGLEIFERPGIKKEEGIGGAGEENEIVKEEIRTEELPKFLCRKEDITETIRRFNQAKRPLLLLGHGIRKAGAVKDARRLYEYMGVPVMTSWNGVDLIEDEHPLFYGRPGAIGHRSANFIQQNADFVLTIGSRLNLLSTGYNYRSFLEKAWHVMVEIDACEMEKKSVHPQQKIQCDAGAFIRALWERREELDVREQAKQRRSEWISYCDKMKEKYPRFIPEQKAGEGYVSTYHLVDEISRQMRPEDIYQFTSSGTAVDISMQTFRIKWGQRAFLTKGLAAMGFDLPACIGSGVALRANLAEQETVPEERTDAGVQKTGQVVCVTGDGSIMMNIQELEVLRRLQLPVKIFVVDNRGYSMIYGSQNGNFKGRLTGCTEESGLTLPDIGKVAESFGLPTFRIEDESHLAEQVEEVLAYGGPAVCTVHADITQKILPKQANYMRKDGQMASRPLEDMSPLLSREELEGNMLA